MEGGMDEIKGGSDQETEKDRERNAGVGRRRGGRWARTCGDSQATSSKHKVTLCTPAIHQSTHEQPSNELSKIPGVGPRLRKVNMGR